MNRIKLIFIIVIILVFGINTAADAGPFEKLGRGIANSLTGWIEIFTTTYESSKENGMTGIVSGIPEGIVKALVRSLAGVYEIVTFPLPVPADYKSIIEPEFVQIRQFAVVPNEYAD